MAQLYNWPVPCTIITICENPVEYHCNTCGDVLCSKCRDHHMKSNDTKHHNVVPYLQRIKSDRTCLECGDHPGQQCGVRCQTCTRAVCGDCVTSPRHRGHHFLKLDEKIQEKRKEIQGRFERYSDVLSDWQNSLNEIDSLKENYEDNVKQLDKEIVDRANEICSQVRAMEKEYREQLQGAKDASLKVLQDEQITLTGGIQKLKAIIKELEDTLRSDEPTTLLQYNEGEKDSVLIKPSCHNFPPFHTFKPGSSKIQVLKELFGTLSDDSVLKMTHKPVESGQMMSLLAESALQTVIEIRKDRGSPAIACLQSGEAWVRTAGMRLQLINRQGAIMKTSNLCFDVHAISLTPQGDIILGHFSKRFIKAILHDGDVKTIFNTKKSPVGVCCLPNGDILVALTYDNAVVQYSSTGKIIREIESSEFQHPMYVAHSTVNQQLYVCDKSDPGKLGSPGKILAFDMNGIHQYTYTGTDDATFTPGGLCADQAGHVLITDCRRDRVHILNKDGSFLQYLMTREQGLARPWAIDVDNEGFAWIVEHNRGLVKVVKYI